MKYSIVLLSISIAINLVAKVKGIVIFPPAPAGWLLAIVLIALWSVAGLLLAIRSFQMFSKKKVEKEFITYFLIILLLLAIDVVFFL